MFLLINMFMTTHMMLMIYAYQAYYGYMMRTIMRITVIVRVFVCVLWSYYVHHCAYCDHSVLFIMQRIMLIIRPML